MTTRDTSGRVAIQHAVNQIVDGLEAEYGLLSDEERIERLRAASELVSRDGVAWGVDLLQTALVVLGAQAQLWAEALQAEARR